MLAYTYIEHGRFELREKPKPEILDSRDAIVRVTLSSICTSDLHIKHGSVPRAVPGITVGHEMVGVVSSANNLPRGFDSSGNIIPMYGWLPPRSVKILLSVTANMEEQMSYWK